MNKNHKSPEEIAFWESGSKPVKIGISAFVSFLGFFFLIGFLANIRYLVADDFALLAFSIVFLTLGFRMFRYFLNPRVQITSEMLYVRGFWRVQSWELAKISKIATKKEKLKRRRESFGAPLVIEWIVLELEDGRSTRFIAPGFVGNERLLTILSERLGIIVDRDTRSNNDIPIGKSPFK